MAELDQAAELKCPKCDQGFAGRDCFDEAIDCHYCDGTGRITADQHCQLMDKFQELVGDAMVTDLLLKDSTANFDRLWSAFVCVTICCIGALIGTVLLL